MGPRGTSSDNPDRAKGKNDGHKRDKAKINLLRMYRSGKPTRDRQGRILGGDFMMKDKVGNQSVNAETGRVAPDRRWFGNTRIVSATELDKFRDVMSKHAADPYTVVLRSKAMPLGLLTDAKSAGRAHLLSAESFSTTFGPKKQRKRPKLSAPVLEELVSKASASGEHFVAHAPVVGEGLLGAGNGGTVNTSGPLTRGEREEDRDPVFQKGTSRRIWGELHKVLDSSDVVCIVLDARDPAGTRSRHVERHLKENASHKQVVFILNKVDLVPTWVTRRWVASLSCEYPTLAFHAGVMNKPFGKGALIALLRQLSKLHSEKKTISVGFVGYPNVGKSSIINALKMKKVCNVAPIPGETKVWQYITLMKRVNLIDCPGVVYEASGDSELNLVLKGVVRAEKLHGPEYFIPGLLEKVKKEHIAATYGIPTWTDSSDLLEQIARKAGRLLPGGEPNLPIIAINMINDWQRGKLPYYTPPPEAPHRLAALQAAGAGAGAFSVAAHSGKGDTPSLTAPASAPLAVALQPEQDLRRVGRHELLAHEEEVMGKDLDEEMEDGVEKLDEEEEEEEEEANAASGAGARVAAMGKGEGRQHEAGVGHKRKRPAGDDGADVSADSVTTRIEKGRKKQGLNVNLLPTSSMRARGLNIHGRPPRAKHEAKAGKSGQVKGSAQTLAEKLLRATAGGSSRAIEVHVPSHGVIADGDDFDDLEM